MIVVSLLLIAGAATMLVLGVWQSSSELLSGSIAASLLAAIMLVVGARRGTAFRPGQERAGSERSGRDHGEPDRSAPDRSAPDRSRRNHAVPDYPTADYPAVADGGAPPAGGGSAASNPTRTIPAQHGAPPAEAPAGGAAGHGTGHTDDGADPPDEPAPQQVSAADAAKVGRMLTEVLVVDGRPRYHLAGCVHLLGRDPEPLPVNEAIELGFSPCSLCEPDSALLADARRV